ncbi:MAG TPA: TolC family protein [Oxalicibacterium sp.]|uniref:TolC family protein n=1 Tax=Oxalicibacterium sp. TaxID=2766525 RepID=UPI002D06F41F|nr:TolC family protein [Oxalicibacterium sp.]HWU98494.1 TolC family protein [Oxalicibacterium sp.]
MYRYFLALAFAGGLCASAWAQTTRTNAAIEPAGPITLDQALALALDANAELSAARNEADAVNASITQANVLPNPDVSLLVEDTRRETRTTTVLFNQPIELGGKRDARVKAASRAHDAARADLLAVRATTRATVTAVFFDVLNAQEKCRLAEASLALAQHATETVAKRVVAGKISPVEETRSRVASANIRLALNQANSELAQARKRLAAIWGNPHPRFEHAVGELEQLPVLPDWPTLEQRLQQSPSLTRARHEVARRDAMLRVETSRRTPDVTVSMGVKREEEAGRNQAVIGVSIPFPFFDRNQGNMLEALRRTDKARDELAAAEIRLDGELSQAWQQLANARQEVEVLQREILPGAQSAYDAASKGFAFGKFGFIDVLDAQRTLLEARSRYLQTLSEAHRAAAEMDRILGESQVVIK